MKKSYMNSLVLILLIETKHATAHHQKAKTVDKVSFEVTYGAAVVIIGNSGAGKTTILRALSGLVWLTSGEACFPSKRISELEIHENVKHGLIHFPEGRRVFPQLTAF